MTIKRLNEPVYEMDYDDLDKMCREEFGLPTDWSCVTCWECQNDVSKIIQISRRFIDKEYMKAVETDIAVETDTEMHGGPARMSYSAPPLMMQIMYERGKLQAGIYIVHVSW